MRTRLKYAQQMKIGKWMNTINDEEIDDQIVKWHCIQ